MTNLLKSLAFGATLTVVACGASPAMAEFFDIPKPDTSQREQVAEILKDIIPDLQTNPTPAMKAHPFQKPVCEIAEQDDFDALDRLGYYLQGWSEANGVYTALGVTRDGRWAVFSFDGRLLCTLMSGKFEFTGIQAR